jgi:16S rRNA (adenine1518-N6/adenine1519-N6)-dimethyltransferase
MDLLQYTQQLCRQYDISPQKSKGQHFLIKQDVIERIIEASQLTADDTAVEIGPGLGVLTMELVKHAGRVLTIELDQKVITYLKAQLATISNVELVESDVLRVQPRDLGLTEFGYKVVANLPYNITAPILRKFLEPKIAKKETLAQPRPSEMVVMVQKEVAERLIAQPGEMSIRAISAQFYADVEMLFVVGRDDFYPAPRVDSAVIRIRLKQELPHIDIPAFFRLVRIGFSARRKQLHNNLSSGFHLSRTEATDVLTRADLRTDIRAQDLSIEQWMKLLAVLSTR